MTMFVESPWPTVMLVVVAQVILSLVFLRTGRWWAIVAMAVVLVLAAGMLYLERAIVTDTEQVEDTLHEIAESLEANDAPSVLAQIAPECPRRAEVEQALDRVTIRSASVGPDLQVRLSPLTTPPSATAYFTGRIEGKDNRGTIPYDHFARKFKVRLERRGDRWLVTGYEDAEPGKRLD
jgi:hypothetical protein